MRHFHGIRIGGALLVAVLMAASSLLMAAPALAATTKALAFVTQNGACCGAGYYGGLSGLVSASVGSTTPTPSVYIRSGHLSATDTTTTAVRVYKYHVVIPVDGVIAASDYEQEYALHQLHALPAGSITPVRFSTLPAITFQ